MKAVVFDLVGKFAHFRKFYTNSSSLSYLIPPRTTLQGVCAAILGYERDTYYEKLSKERFSLTVTIKSTIRRIMQTVNYISIKNESDIYKYTEHTQIPFEILCGDDEIRYRVYASHKDEEINLKLYSMIKDNQTELPLYMGCAPFSCVAEFVGFFDLYKKEPNQSIDLRTPLNIKEIEGKSLDFSQELSLIKERMPADFTKERNCCEVNSYIYEETGKPVYVKLKHPYYQVDSNESENIIFM